MMDEVHPEHLATQHREWSKSALRKFSVAVPGDERTPAKINFELAIPSCVGLRTPSGAAAAVTRGATLDHCFRIIPSRESSLEAQLKPIIAPILVINPPR
jgi:hypothetical protein